MKTIKYIITLTLILAVTGNVNAGLLRFGIKGGVNTSHLRTENGVFNQPITDGHVGLWLNAPLPGAFSIQPELLFTQKGSKRVYDSSDSFTTKVRLGLDYVEMPVHLVYQVFRNIEVELGPYWGYLLNQDAYTLISNGSVDLSYLQTLEMSDFQRLDLGLSVGARLRVKGLYFGCSYKAGFESVSKGNNFTQILLGDATNQTFQIYLALPF